MTVQQPSRPRSRRPSRTRKDQKDEGARQSQSQSHLAAGAGPMAGTWGTPQPERRVPRNPLTGERIDFAGVAAGQVVLKRVSEEDLYGPRHTSSQAASAGSLPEGRLNGLALGTSSTHSGGNSGQASLGTGRMRAMVSRAELARLERELERTAVQQCSSTAVQQIGMQTAGADEGEDGESE